jgi:prepilin-type N-terminal cleavage/methylation domain-containing protein
MAIRKRLKGGFTLVELAVVVVIVGVLSVIAVVGYRKIVMRGKLAEATHVIGAIRIAQEDHKSEKGYYADIGATTFCPQAGDGTKKTQWNPACNGGTSPWSLLPVHVADPVLFGYKTSGGSTGFADKYSTSGWVNYSSQPTDRPWYQIYAEADIDPGSTAKTQFVTTNGTNQIFSQNEGE